MFVDIPGTYSIMSNSEEEEIARDYICFGNPDSTIVVVDATCLERNLNLLFQIMEITDNVILCVNLLDEAKKKKIKIDLKKLSTLLGIPVVGTVARNKKTLDVLLNTVVQVCEKKFQYSTNIVSYSPIIEDAISDLCSELKNQFVLPENLYRWIALKILDGENSIIKSIEQNLNINIINNDSINLKKQEIFNNLYKENITNSNFKDKIVSCIMDKAKNICNQVCIFENKNYTRKR